MKSYEYAIEVTGLKKSYGDNKVLKGVNFKVRPGKMLAILGPNGAGKTTTVRVLSTLLNFDSGKVKVAGLSVDKNAEEVRLKIGLTGQSAALDELLTGRENLILMGRLYRLTKKSATNRAEELLKEFDLVKAANRPVKTYSGGMRRRLDLAVSLIATPPIIFLDEPTTGLDPRSRLAMWEIIKNLMSQGTTILLTTQYLEEADQLADQIIVIDGGKVIAEGTPAELKRSVGKDRLNLTLKDVDSIDKAVKVLANKNIITDKKSATLSLTIDNVNKDVKKALDDLGAAKIDISLLEVHKPTLDDVFLQLTGKKQDSSAKNKQKKVKK